MNNNTSLRSADRLTHLKIVGVALVAAVAVIGVGLAANSKANMGAQLEARAPVLKPSKPILWSINEQLLIR
jgi:hypothetical protein